jgi:hypothetical protein
MILYIFSHERRRNNERALHRAQSAALLDLAILALAGLALRTGLSLGLARRAASGWTRRYA